MHAAGNLYPFVPYLLIFFTSISLIHKTTGDGVLSFCVLSFCVVSVGSGVTIGDEMGGKVSS